MARNKTPYVEQERRSSVAYKRKRELVGEIGSMSETGGKVKNDAALKVEHMLDKKTAEIFGETLEELRREPQQYSVVFKDRGLRLKAMQAIAEHGRVTDFPIDPSALYMEFDNYINYCFTFMVAPSIGMFAVWMGISLKEWERREDAAEAKDPAMHSAMTVCKETIRGFIESQALDGNVPAAVYLHQNKAYYDAVEKSEVIHTNVEDGHVKDIRQIDDIVSMLPG